MFYNIYIKIFLNINATTHVGPNLPWLTHPNSRRLYILFTKYIYKTEKYKLFTIIL